VPPLEPEIDRREDQDRHHEHDPEVVRIAGERVRPVDARAADGAVDVDRRRAAGERREHRLVEVVARLRGEELEDPVDAVRDDARREP
jgi:hypothetical protein